MMNSGKLSTIARPYVTAAFEYALGKKDLHAWENFLQTAATVVQDESIAQLLKNPSVTQKQVADFIGDLIAPQLDEGRKNFIRLLAENERLAVLPDVFLQFKKEREDQEKTLAVQVFSAQALDDAYQQKLQQALSKRLQRQVELECNIDPNLLGGVLIRAGDLVIDGSVRGKLARLVDFI